MNCGAKALTGFRPQGVSARRSCRKSAQDEAQGQFTQDLRQSGDSIRRVWSQDRCPPLFQNEGNEAAMLSHQGSEVLVQDEHRVRDRLRVELTLESGLVGIKVRVRLVLK